MRMRKPMEVVPLRQRGDLLHETAKLLNSEWPRSLSARLASLEESEGDLPCSLILLHLEDEGEDRVLGHVRLHGVIGRPNAVLVEGLLVDRNWRGKGLGKLLMQEAENYTKTLHYTSMHLSTNDQQGFYRHLGFVDGFPSSSLRSCVAKFNKDETECLIGEVMVHHTGSLSLNDRSKSSSFSSSHRSSHHSVLPSQLPPLPVPTPPPPPPPPPPVKLSSTSTSLIWLTKVIS